MSLRPSLPRGILLRLLSGGGLLLSVAVVLGLVFGVFLLVTRPTAKKEPHDPPIVPGKPNKDQPGQGDGSKGEKPKDGTPSDDHPKSNAEIVKERFDNGKENIKKLVVPGAEEVRRKAVEEDTADDPNYWIWLHIKEGNFSSSVYHSGKGLTSFQACVKSPSFHPNIINGDIVYDYDFSRNTASPRTASFPTVTVRQLADESETLLVAIIKSDPLKNTHRLEMLDGLLKSGADPNLRFGSKAHTALMEAVLDGNEALIKCLLAHGADRHLKDLDNETARDCTQSESIRELLK